MDLSQLNGRMQTLALRVRENAASGVRKVAISAGSTVVMATPVDTGRARANWQTSVNESATDSGTDGTLPEPASPEVGAQAAIAGLAATVAGYKTGQTVHISNNLDYIADLNNGSSAQAPAGFVQKAIIAGAEAAGAIELLRGA